MDSMVPIYFSKFSFIFTLRLTLSFKPFRYAYEAYMWNQYTGFPIGALQPELHGYSLGLWPCILLLFAVGLIIRACALCALKLLVKRLQ